ncbi:hypothetical protein [Erwinia tasmaniensis]|uniref:Uncharacterized protein n=1 Tax=Erwinia tasmaniensis (strain DSM 17950 / CFBP 7177 / CIP 109463 / NCPPB 4357 / Et1/99) TaxID=465817 RepID=B2VB26_ERWT9|nr:hypothetical protein [Erwinia tasmaniensis]CAO94948.1 hypothetical protein ETA_pET450040 [Erwinia tasmaniensis Et1/99]
MGLFASNTQEMKEKLAAIKKAVNDKRAGAGLRTITNEHLIFELVCAAFHRASNGSGTGLYISNMFIKV